MKKAVVKLSPEEIEAAYAAEAAAFKKRFKWSEETVSAALVNHYIYAAWNPDQILAAPNVIFQGFERDLMVVSKSGLVYEIEVKVSVADLRAEFAKSGRKGSAKKQKHQLMKAGRCGVNRYFVAVPVDILKKALELVPEEYGVISVDFVTGWVWENNRKELHVTPRASIVRKASLLDKEGRAGDDMRKKLLESCYHKVWNRLGWQSLIKK